MFSDLASSMSISVIIPAYNAAEFLDETIASVVTQEYPVDEIIIVDDGSTDATTDVVHRWIQKIQRIRLIQQTNQGVSSARNHGFRLSQGEMVAFLDSDDCWDSRFTARGMKSFSQGADVFVAASRRFYKLPGDAPSPFILNDEYVRNFPQSLVRENVIVPSMVMMKRHVMDTVGGFADDAQMWEDWDFWMKLVGIGAKFDFETAAGLVHYREVPHSRSSAYESGCERCVATLQHHLGSSWAPQHLLRKQISWWLRQRGNLESRGRVARKYYWESLRYHPFASKSWAKWMLSFLR